ncbi:lipocalin family protein [Nonomuraea sp. NPDC049714]|uniref:lipocalin family protein n=1 Tax=Nonomuraea sp. NPDC049714 TaxID=3364357 RepID=UPI0037AA548D
MTAMLGSMTSLSPAQAVAGNPGAAKTVAAGSGIPVLVDPAVDLAARTPGPEHDWADSIYFTSRVKAGSHDIGLLVHTVSIPKGPGNLLLFSVHDETTGWYKSYATVVPENDFAWSTKELDITAPGLKWTGNAQRMSVSLDVPWGSLDVVLQARGPALNYGSTGAFPLFGQTNYEFALPDMRITGTVTFDGRRQQITGRSWLDRQWGPIDNAPKRHWSWMNFNMPNGDSVAIWDAVSDNGQTHTWATVLRKDGSYEVASVTPFADSAGKFWTSPTTGQKYPTQVTVNIPALKTRLKVHVTGKTGQEIILGGNGRLEATAAFEGTYQGAKVTGKNFFEMFGDWQS